MKTVTKYTLASSLIVILTISLFGFFSLNRYHDYEVRRESVWLETCIRTLWQLLANKGTDFRIADNKLLAGDYQVNGNLELPDEVQRIFGGVATIFMGDVRVSTNVLDAGGKRALGTRLVGSAYDSIFRQGKPYRGRTEILGVPYLTAYDPIRDRSGKVIGVLFVGVKESDFLARLHVMERHLALTLVGLVAVVTLIILLLGRAMKRVDVAHENQIRFQQTLIDTIPNPIFYKDAACRYLGCNKAFEAYVGLSRSELIGHTPHEIWPAALADRYRQQDLALLERPGLQVYETKVQYADGTLRDVIFNKATFDGEDGAVAGLVGVILDITERKTAEDALLFQNILLSSQQEASIDGILVVDEETRILSYNRRFVEIWDIPAPLLETKEDEPVLRYATGRVADPQQFLEKVRYLYEHRQDSSRDEISLVDGRTLDRYTVPLLDAHGRYYGRLWSFRDITERKLAEQKRALLQAQLQHGRMLESFMVRLSHDLRTPLTPMVVLFPLIRGRVDDPELQGMLDICQKGVASLKKLVDRAQMLVSLTATSSKKAFEPTPLVYAVEMALADNEESMARKRVTCQMDFDSSLIVTAVPDQLRELFANLIANAVRFSPEDGRVRITAEQRAETVMVAVADNGIGLAQGHLECIFDEFFKADESRHDLDASGLGLSICKRIMLNHHGRIWAESPGIGQGATIKFTINEENADRYM